MTHTDPATPPPNPERTEAVETRSRWPGLVWAFPAAALLVVTYLGVQALAHGGVEVVLTFDSAADAKPGDTQVVYKGLSVGHVTKVALDRDGKHVDMTLKLDPNIKPLLRTGTKFWLVGAKPSLTDINSLRAALAGVTIGMAPGEGAPTRRFEGLDEPPQVLPGTAGAAYTLVSSQVGAARPGASVFYHGLEVGKVTDVDLLGRNDFKTKIFVTSPYDHFVRTGTLFYNASAVQISLSGGGISTQIAPGNAAFGGGVEFDTPPDIVSQPVAHPGSTFPLFVDRGRAIAGPRGPQVFYRVLFNDPVGDLDVGAPVTLRGFQVGSVTSRNLEINPVTGALLTPITIGVEPERLYPRASAGPRLTPQMIAQTDKTMGQLIRAGYRARLTQNPPLVGGRVVDLAAVTGAPKAGVAPRQNGDDFPILPSTSSGDVASLTAKVDDILSKVQQVPIVEIGQNLRQMTDRLSTLVKSPEVKDSMVHLDSSLSQLDAMMKQVRPKVGPLIDNLNQTADQAQKLAASANAVVSGDGSTQDASLPGALRQITDAARSLRALADYLGRHPRSRHPRQGQGQMKRSLSFILAAAGLLSACSGAATRFYTLEPAAPIRGLAQSYGGAPFRIDAVHIPASLDRPELVRDDGGGRFTVSDNDHWAAPVGELLRRVLTQDLAAQLPAGKVVYPDAPKPPGSAGLVVDILSISSAGGQVAMDVSWTLIPAPNPGGRTTPSGRQRTLRVTTPAMGSGVGANAIELSALAAQLAAAIAESLAQPAT